MILSCLKSSMILDRGGLRTAHFTSGLRVSTSVGQLKEAERFLEIIQGPISIGVVLHKVVILVA